MASASASAEEPACLASVTPTSHSRSGRHGCRRDQGAPASPQLAACSPSSPSSIGAHSCCRHPDCAHIRRQPLKKARAYPRSSC
eukprot:747815-Prymnesium_polylepis.1